MKSLTKKALSLAMAMAMAGSFAVSAAGVTITNDIEKPEATTVSVDIALGTDLTADSQVTMIAYKVADAEGNAINGGEPGESNIVYINQFAATDLSTGFDGSAEAAVTQEFIMRDGEDFVADGKIVPGTYKIMFGWTGVAVGEAAEATLVVTEETATIMLGDVYPVGAPDGIINISDVTAVLNDYLGVTPLTGDAFTAADVYPIGAPDGIINISDVTAVLNDYLGVTPLN